MAEDGTDAERAARLFGENVVNALVDAIEKRMKTEDVDDLRDHLAVTRNRLDGVCNTVIGISRKLDSFATQVSTCDEVVKSVGDPRLAMRRNVEAFVTQMEDRIGEKIDRLDKLVCDRLDRIDQQLATAAADIGNAKAECMRLDEVARQQSERIDVNVCHGTDQNSDLVRRVVRLERDLAALEIVAFKGSPTIGPSWKSRLETMAARVDGLSKSVGEVEREIENRAEPDRNPTSLNWVTRELAAANEHADRRERDADAGWRSKNGVRPGDLIGLGSFIPDPTTSSIEQRNAALELAHAEIRRLTMALERVKSKMHEETSDRKRVRQELDALLTKVVRDVDADQQIAELRAEIRRLVEHGSEAAERMQTKTDDAEQAEWRKTAEDVVKYAGALIASYAGEGDKPVFREPSSQQIAARMDLAEAIELHEKACSERARDLPF